MIKGSKMSEESRLKMSKSRKGMIFSEEHKKKISKSHIGLNTWMKGRKMSKEIKDKISSSTSSINNHFYGKKHLEETKKKISITRSKNPTKYWLGKKRPELMKRIHQMNKGSKRSLECRMKMGVKGSKNPAWRGGITPINTIIRQSLEYRIWRESVFKRDNYTCIWCGARNGCGKTVILNADHIKPFAHYPELRFAIDNGRTLCKECHKTTDTYGAKLLYKK